MLGCSCSVGEQDICRLVRRLCNAILVCFWHQSMHKTSKLPCKPALPGLICRCRATPLLTGICGPVGPAGFGPDGGLRRCSGCLGGPPAAPGGSIPHVPAAELLRGGQRGHRAGAAAERGAVRAAILAGASGNDGGGVSEHAGRAGVHAFRSAQRGAAERAPHARGGQPASTLSSLSICCTRQGLWPLIVWRSRFALCLPCDWSPPLWPPMPVEREWTKTLCCGDHAALASLNAAMKRIGGRMGLLFVDCFLLLCLTYAA